MPDSVSPEGLTAFLRRPWIIIGILSLAAVVAFLIVTHLVNRFGEQQKALARHLFAQGQANVGSGRPDLAIRYFRAALGYNPADFDYQLSLARALRDTGRFDESRSYLMNLWEREPQDGAVNLALGRLAAREHATNDAIHYYHNAVYGIWSSDPEAHRSNAQFELIDFLLRQNALPQAQAELITLAASLPVSSELRTRVAKMFAQTGDYEHALAEYQTVLQRDRLNAAAQAGAGDSAFHLHHYRTAQRYLAEAVESGANDPQTTKMLKLAKLVIDMDPFVRGLPVTERNQRVRLAFDRAEQRLKDCLSTDNVARNNSAAPSDLLALEQQWNALAPKTSRHPRIAEQDSATTVMDLVFEIERETEQDCGEGTGTDIDQALLILAKGSDGVDQ